MTLKKFMHPRNMYKQAPNFKELALLYPKFRDHVVVDLTGKVKIDFGDESTLRSLTETLLYHDFKLNVTIPENKLVPTLPLRLNYILWIEDLMGHCSLTEMKDAVGLDIGTGAVCIYPLLFANMYGNRMIGTEIDETSVATAKEQVDKNNYQDLIKILQVNGESILKGVLQEAEVCHFSMCNPPFFEMEEITGRPEKKKPPRNAPTGTEKELTIEGGERAFVSKMIEESIEIKERIKVYTTMLGRKSTLFFVIKFMKDQNIDNLTWTEFCQGHTKRWGLAWTFLPKKTYDLATAPVIRGKYDPAVNLLKAHRPYEISFPLNDASFPSFNEFVKRMREIIQELNLEPRELATTSSVDSWSCQITARRDTWTHARRKRRLAQRGTSASQPENDADGMEKCEERVSEKEPEDNGTGSEPLLVCRLFAELVDSEDEPDSSVLSMWMVYDRGGGGKNSLITLREYLLNKLKIRDLVRGQPGTSGKNKKRKRKKDQGKTETDPSESFETSAEKLPRHEDSSPEENEDSS